MRILKFGDFINEGMISDFRKENKGVKLTDEQKDFLDKLKKSFDSINMVYFFKNPEDKCYYPDHLKDDKKGSWDMEKITDKAVLIMPEPTKERLGFWTDKKYKENEKKILYDVFSWFENAFSKFAQGDKKTKKLIIELRELLKKTEQIENKIL